MRLFRVTVEVGEAEAARAFYGALFGERPQPVGGGRLYLRFGETILALLSTGNAPRGTPQELYFVVEDLEAVYDRARKLGALAGGEVHEDPAGAIATRPWGERSFYAVDPWGNGLSFVQSGTIFTGE